MDGRVTAEEHSESNPLLSSDKSRPSLPSTLKISEEEFTSEGGPISLSSSRRTSSSQQVSIMEGHSQYQTEQEEDDDSEHSSTLRIEISGVIYSLDTTSSRNFEAACERLRADSNLSPDLLLCMKIVLLRDLRCRDYRFASLYRNTMLEYMESKFELLQNGD